jgi:glutamine synthetase
MSGIKQKIHPGEPHQENIYHLTRKQREKDGIGVLPEHLGEAVELFEKDQVIKDAIGDFLHSNLVKMKKNEFEEYQRYTGVEWPASRPNITKWEYDRYLTRS